MLHAAGAFGIQAENTVNLATEAKAANTRGYLFCFLGAHCQLSPILFRTNNQSFPPPRL
jgi:hypothetical protein